MIDPSQFGAVEVGGAQSSQMEAAPLRAAPSPEDFGATIEDDTLPQYQGSARRIVEEQPEGVGEKVKAAFTGKGRRPLDLPEFDLPFEFSTRQAKTALGLMTTFDPKRGLQVLKTHYPDLRFSEDEAGNIVVDGSAYGGKEGYLNAPGVSVRDLADLGFQVAAFTPAAKLGGLAAGTGARVGLVGAGSAATQATQDVANQALGGTEDVSLANIDKKDVAIAGVGGAAFERLGILAAKWLPALKRTGGKITDRVRDEFRKVYAQAGKNPAEVTDDVINSYLKAAAEAVDEKAVPAIRDTQELGIPYTRGQATGDLKQLQLEDSLRGGAFGGKSQQTMQTFQEKVQAPAIEQARTAQQAKLSGGTPVIERPTEAGEVLREGLKSRAATLDDAIAEAYEQVGEASLSVDGMRGLTDAMRKVTRSVTFERNADLVPASASLLKELDQYSKTLQAIGPKLRPIHIQKLESFRRRLNNKIGTAANPTDRRQVTQLKAAFDGYLDDAVDNALFSGDETALDALKNARALRAEYAKKFQRMDSTTKSGRAVKDEAGDAVERIIAASPTDEQVVNYVFGASKIGGKQAGAKVAERLKSVLGADSKEWQAIREAGFLKLSDAGNSEAVSGAAFHGRLLEATKEAPTLMRTLYTEGEVKGMFRLALAIKRAQPRSMNPSGTAYKASQIAQQAWEQMLSTLGFTQGGIGGAVAARGAAEGLSVVSGLRGAGKAMDAVRGASKAPRLSIGNIGAAGGRTASE